jgi:glucan phosphoethanolaminetransferase (alkaline phosphatase superfamily)
MGLMILPNVLAVWVSRHPWDAAVRSLPISLLFLSGLLAWIQRPAWVVGLLVPFYLLLPAEVLYITQYGGPSNSHILGILSETNLTEAAGYVGWITLACALVSTVLLIWLAVVSLAYLPARVSPHRAWRWLRIATGVVVISLGCYTWFDPQEQVATSDQVVAGAVTVTSSTQAVEAIFFGEAHPINELYSGSFPVGVPLRIWGFWQELTHLRYVAARMANVPPPQVWATHTNQADQPTTVVLVIGESSRPDHWALNGYLRNTTPELSTKNGVISFDNVISPWSSTRRAVPLLLVGAMESTHLASMNHPSVLRIFKAAGYKTAWISNQSPLGPHDSLITIHARQADKVVYTNGASYNKSGATDEVLLAPLVSFLNDGAGKKFVALHLLGSHKRYIDRYPSTFGPFKPTLREGVNSDEATVNAYDNSVAYTDHVLSEVIKLLMSSQSDQRTMLLYISDHGQTLPKNGCQFSGHGTANEADHRVSALVWFSDTLLQSPTSRFDLLKSRQSAAFYSPEVVHSLLDMAGLSYEGHKPNWSWMSPEWKPQTRWTDAVSNFDQATKEGSCGELKN